MILWEGYPQSGRRDMQRCCISLAQSLIRREHTLRADRCFFVIFRERALRADRSYLGALVVRRVVDLRLVVLLRRLFPFGVSTAGKLRSDGGTLPSLI